MFSYIALSHSRNFALYDGEDLVAVTVYRKGAEAIRERLEADARTIEDLQRQIAELPTLAAHFREQAIGMPRPPQQLPLIAAEDMPVYRVTSPPQPRATSIGCNKLDDNCRQPLLHRDSIAL